DDNRRFAGADMGVAASEISNTQQWKIFEGGGKEFLDLFDKGLVADMNPARNGDSLTLKDAERRQDRGTYDYVITSNTINDPDTELNRNFPFIAAAHLLKKGGRVFHLVGYSPDFYDQTFDHPYLPQIIGQRVIARQAIPQGSKSQAGRYTFIGLEQNQPCH